MRGYRMWQALLITSRVHAAAPLHPHQQPFKQTLPQFRIIDKKWIDKDIIRNLVICYLYIFIKYMIWLLRYFSRNKSTGLAVVVFFFLIGNGLFISPFLRDFIITNNLILWLVFFTQGVVFIIFTILQPIPPNWCRK